MERSKSEAKFSHYLFPHTAVQLMTTTDQTFRFHYCISLIVFTWYRESEPVVLGPSQSLFLAALPYNLITVLLGWWGLPWGIFLTPIALLRNLTFRPTTLEPIPD